MGSATMATGAHYYYTDTAVSNFVLQELAIFSI